MALYKCQCGQDKEIAKATIVFREGKWVCKQALCDCGKYMDSEAEEGMPSIRRTESSLSKKQKGDMMWDSAKEKLCGERGINEPFN